MKNKKIVIAGGTGFIGQALARYFGKDNQIVIISRQSVNGHNNNYSNKLLLPAQGYNITYRRWDGEHLEKHWTSELEAADMVINLAGKSVNCQYTEKNKKAIMESRVLATNAIGAAIRNCIVPPRLWVNAGSATIYRNATDHPQDEYTGEIKDDFSVEVCKQWEATMQALPMPATRKIILRMAITLGNGGVMVPYFNLLKFGMGGRQGNGRQMYSWLHIEDTCRIIEWVHEHGAMEGIYNCASPNAVTNAFFMQTLRNTTATRFALALPNWIITLGAWLIGTEKELLLKSRWVAPARLLQSGFLFKYPALPGALTEIVKNTDPRSYHFVRKSNVQPEKNGACCTTAQQYDITGNAI
ncbi:MAG: TIGR01777 family oxidoreductase [Chitinophagaceae bacterium]